MTRKEILEAAMSAVSRDNYVFDEQENNFQLIANFWNIYLKGVEGGDLEGDDVAVMMALLKIARIMTGYGGMDSYIDLAGYAACAGEVRTADWDEGIVNL